jgi:hypothetical protein
MSTLTQALLVALALLTGCKQPAPPPPSGPPPATKQDARNDFHRENDPTFNQRERGLIAAARLHLAATEPRVSDAFHRVRHNDAGDEVFVLFVTGYEGDKPVFTPCEHAAVYFDNDGAVTKVLRGPACWP